MKVRCAPEVKKALAAGRPVVALESTIIAHGMPFPQNLEMAQAVEQAVRQEGAVPATIAVVKGELRAGLSSAELSQFAQDGRHILKVSTRDLPHVVARKLDGATTVASTMRIAALAGIRVFATGGIGGVHRGAARTFDVSADLVEFSRSDVAVVTAGAKAILDLALTLEYLETLGVPVVGVGTDEFPAFYSRSSGLRLALPPCDEQLIAAMMRSKWVMGLSGGIVVANPIPSKHEIPASEIAPAIASAVKEAEAKGIGGKDVTPFLLQRLNEVTQGRSLAANMELVLNNARVAARLAGAYARLLKSTKGR
jgi:pseudouridine-5'-phosphate glycosidase